MADAYRALTEALERFGVDSLTSQPNLCRNTLRDKLPDRPREAALLVTALEAGVPTRLRTESQISDVDTVAAQLAGGLERSHGLSPESARWAVQTWATALDSVSPATAPSHPSEPKTDRLEAETVLRTPSDAVTAPPPTADAVTAPPSPSDAVTAPPSPSDVVTAPPSPSDVVTAPPTPSDNGTAPYRTADAVTAPPTPSDVVTAPPMPTGAETVLRTAPGDAGTTPPEPPDAAAPEERGGGWSRRRLIGVGGAVALVGIIVAVALLVFGGSNGGPPRAAGHSTAAQSAINGTKTSAAAASSGLSGTTSSSSSVTTPGFAPISRVLAHAGGNEGFPEETLPAFLQAAHRGFTVESDVRWTKDGVPVFNHDTTTGLGMICSGGPYVVAETNWAVLRDRCATPPSASKTHRSYGIPTFDTAVQQLSQIPGATLFAELKVDPTPAQSRQYLQILRRWDMLSRTVVTSYVSSYLTHFDAEAAREGVRIRTLRFANTGSPTTLADLQQLHVWGASFQEPWDRIPTLIAGARRAGIHVGIETSPKWDDGPAHWSEAKRLGAEFLITSKPSAYSAWLDQHG